MIKKKNYFSELVDKHFAKLVTNYGFKKIESDSGRGEYWVKFRNSTTIITVYGEVYDVSWINITDITKSQPISTTLGILLDVLEIEKLSKIGKIPRPAPRSINGLERLLQKRSRQLFKYAADFLNGDFSLMPQLKAFERKRLKDYEMHNASKIQ